MTVRVLNRALPCRHTVVSHVSATAGAPIARTCRMCKRRFVGYVERSALSAHVGEELRRIRWEEVVPKAAR